MTATRLVTQFDDPHGRALAVATPTCCSCCCCCCGVTLATSATLTAVHLNHTAAVSAPARRPLLTAGGALAAPVAAGLLVVVASASALSDGVRVGLGVLVAAALLGVCTYLYRVAGHPRPWLPALIVVAATAAGMGAEFYVNAYTGSLLLEVLAIPVPILAGIWAYRKLKARREPGMGRA